MKNRISKNFHVPLNNLSSVKTAKSSLPRGHMGGANWGYLELGSGTPWVRGSIYKKKVLQDPGPNTHTAATIRKEVLTPPSPPPPPPKGVPRCGGGGYGVQNTKNHWRIIFGPKMMILQGVRHQKPYIGVCYANDPKKGGGYTTLAPALDLTTSLQGDLHDFTAKKITQLYSFFVHELYFPRTQGSPRSPALLGPRLVDDGLPAAVPVLPQGMSLTAAPSSPPSPLSPVLSGCPVSPMPNRSQPPPPVSNCPCVTSVVSSSCGLLSSAPPFLWLFVLPWALSLAH